MAGVLRNTLYSSVNIYFEYLIGLVISILIARSLGLDSYGLYSYLVKVAGIAIIVTNAGISTGAIKFIAEARARQEHQNIPFIYAYFARIQRMKTAFVVTIIWGVEQMFPGLIIDEEYHALLYALLLAVAFKSAHMFRVGVFKGHERFDYLAFTVFLVAPLNLVAVAFAKSMAWDITAFYVIFAGAALTYWAFSGVYLRRLHLRRPAEGGLSDALQSRMAHHLKIVSINTILAGLVIGQCEVLLLKHLVSNEAVALFNIAFVIAAAALSLVPGVYSAVLFPVIARSVAGTVKEAAWQMRESTRYMFLLGLLVVAPTAFYANDIITLLYGEEFSPAGFILIAMVLVGLIKSFAEPTGAFLMSSDRQTTMLKLTIATFFLSLVLNVGLIMQFGLYGAVAAYCSVTLFFSIILLLLVRYYLGVSPLWGKLIRACFAAVAALLPLLALEQVMHSGWRLFIGFPLFGVLFPLALLVCGSYTKHDYQLINQLAMKIGPRTGQAVQRIIGSRAEV